MTAYINDNYKKIVASIILYILMMQALSIIIFQNNHYLNPVYFIYRFLGFTTWFDPSIQIILLLPLVVLIFAFVFGLKAKDYAKVHGDAHWATLSEVRKFGFLSKTGLIIGDFKNKLLRVNVKSHVLIFAPSRSGKGVSQVIPNALNWNGSLLVTDIKSEVFHYTAGFRKKHGSDVYLFSPSAPGGRTHRFNPLDLVDRYNQTKRVTQLQQILQIIMPDVGGDNQMWVSEARSLALGLLLYIADTDRPFTLGELKDIIKGTPHLSTYLENILKDSVIGTNMVDIDPLCYQNINNFVDKAEKERSGVRSQLISSLNLWDDPYVRAATDSSDFDIRDMRKKPMSIYLGIPERDLNRLRPLVSLFIQQFVNEITDHLPKNDEKYKVLCILDEFCNLGKMDVIKKGASFLAGYNVHLMAIIQNIAQGYEIYGKEGFDAFVSNTDYKICYYQNDVTGSEFVSKLLGNKTVQNRSQSYKGLLSKSSSSFNESFILKPLLTPDEVLKFPKEEAIAIVSGGAPIRYKRIIYYSDDRFNKRVIDPPIIDKIEPIFATVNVNTEPGYDRLDAEELAKLADEID